MDGGVILDELASQLSSADSTLRARAYQTSLWYIHFIDLLSLLMLTLWAVKENTQPERKFWFFIKWTY